MAPLQIDVFLLSTVRSSTVGWARSVRIVVASHIPGSVEDLCLEQILRRCMRTQGQEVAESQRKSQSKREHVSM